ncbi:MAG: uracil-DNA glycosylase family protein [Sulfuricaulis sp.]
MDTRRQQYLDALGIIRWVPRGESAEPAGFANTPVISGATAITPPVPAALRQSPNTELDAREWTELETAVRGCTKCSLHATRTQTVFGVGHRRAQWMFIGEAPGADEDRQGEPFVGRAGQLLNAILFAIGLKREEVYIANVLKCLRYNALVQLGDGSWERIGRLVRSRYDGFVMSVDADGQLTPRRITGWHEAPLGNRRVFRMTYRLAKNAGKSRVGIQLTGDHEVLTQRGFVAVEALWPGDRIATGQGLSPIAFDVVCGTLLGDGYLAADRTMLSFGHSTAQREYALFKADLLKELNPRMDELSVAAVVGGEKIYPVIQVRTLAHRALRILRKDFYPCGKRVPGWMATRLNERMLAFWFLDDGYMRIRPGRQPLAEIATCGFPGEDLPILLEGLSRLGLRAKASRGRLYFDVEATKVLSERIAPYVPPAMRYKLHPDITRRIDFDPDRLRSGPATVLYDDVEIEDITDHKRTDKTFFCIDVEETHNFVTAGGVVHNCRPPGNRDPQPEEVIQCEPYLLRQIELIKPRLIVALGRHAAHSLLKTEVPLGKLRGQRLSYHGTPLIVTYHPAYLLRNPADKRKVWDDLCLAKTAMTAMLDPDREAS